MLRLGTGKAAGLSEKIDWRILYCLKKGLAIIGKGVCRGRRKLRSRCVEFIEIRPQTLQKELRPNQQDSLWDKVTGKAEPGIPKAAFHVERPDSCGNAYGPSNSFKACHSLTARSTFIA